MSRQPKHTPSPWIVEETPTHLWVGYPKAWTHKVSEVVCYFEIGNEFTDDSNELRSANAHLIAAAPDLLEAVRLAVDLVERDVIRVRPSEREELIEALTVWNATIAKALSQERSEA